MSALLLACITISLSGCASEGLDLFGSVKPDRTLATSTVPGAPPKTTEAISDEVTVKNAVTSADVARIGSNPIPWANASTGSAGVITTVQEDTASGAHCRQFRTTRNSYMGIASFMGRTCMQTNGNWQLLSFQEEN
nr:RT0821/Lpp0805 family surface protein [uncultured Gellertiella sp.]